LVNQAPSQLGLVLPQDPMFGCRGSMFGRSGGFNEVQNENSCSWADAFALRGGIKTVMIPAENEKDLTEIPDNVKQGLTIIPVSNVREVLAQALVQAPVPVEWDEAVEEAAAAARQVKAETPAASVAH
jgi:hypothetical protein